MNSARNAINAAPKHILLPGIKWQWRRRAGAPAIYQDKINAAGGKWNSMGITCLRQMLNA